MKFNNFLIINLILVFFLNPILIKAQVISVSSFRILENDMDARQNYPVMDQNGKKCAILKIQTTQKGFDFDGGSMGIVKVVQKTAEIWVYVPIGIRKITIAHAQLGILRDYSFPISISEATCYEMVLVTGKVTTVVDAAVDKQYLVIDSDPEGAAVSIDDQPTGLQTPFQAKLGFGKHTFSLNMDLYFSYAETVELTAQSKITKTITLKPSWSNINVTSSPEQGASVSIDGIPTGKITPCTIEKQLAGNHKVKVEKLWFQSNSAIVTLAEGETKNFNVNMTPTFGIVNVSTEPSSEILIDDQLIGAGTYSGRTLVGTHTFKAKLDKYRPATKDIEVKIYDTVNIKLEPTPIVGVLDVASTPMNATIFVDDKNIGTTPQTNINLLVGTHTLVLEKKGFNSYKQTIEIKEGEITNINASIDNSLSVNFTSDPDNADLEIDGSQKGKTPIAVNLMPGAHNIKITKDGCKGKFETINVSGATTFNYNLELIGRTYDITSSPNGASVYIDGNYKGVTPLRVFLDFTKHDIKLQYIGYADYSATENLTVNSQTLLNYYMSEKMTTGKFWSDNRSNAKSYIKGKPVAMTFGLYQTQFLAYGYTQKKANGVISNKGGAAISMNFNIFPFDIDISYFISRFSFPKGNIFPLPDSVKVFAQQGFNIGVNWTPLNVNKYLFLYLGPGYQFSEFYMGEHYFETSNLHYSAKNISLPYANAGLRLNLGYFMLFSEFRRTFGKQNLTSNQFHLGCGFYF